MTLRERLSDAENPVAFINALHVIGVSFCHEDFRTGPPDLEVRCSCGWQGTNVQVSVPVESPADVPDVELEMVAEQWLSHSWLSNRAFSAYKRLRKQRDRILREKTEEMVTA